MADRFTLHGSPHSQFTYKIALMLRLSGAPFHFRYVSFQHHQHRTPAFLALSRWGQVPVLEHDGRVLVQSAAILEYLADALGTFAAPDEPNRLAVREWLFWNADRLAPPIYGCYGVELGRRGLLPLSYHPEVSALYRRDAERAFDMLDSHLADSRVLAGMAPTIADLCCYGEVPFARLSGINLATRNNVTAWAERLESSPGFAAPFELLPMADAEIAP
ncbi:MAG: glutathione S-transferase family protein [Alphaproteobacteria bacterium]|nr:glutathione S-transferase family protein [Alphaproteobacteria bacterium]MBV9861778.1 glutathione S-transferase family protein [Alphaproteobacteria bacterium]